MGTRNGKRDGLHLWASRRLSPSGRPNVSKRENTENTGSLRFRESRAHRRFTFHVLRLQQIVGFNDGTPENPCISLFHGIPLMLTVGLNRASALNSQLGQLRSAKLEWRQVLKSEMCHARL